MDSGQLFVLALIAIVMIASVFKAKYGYGRLGRHRRDNWVGPDEHSENLRLRDEVKELKERIKVLERITVEKENSLAKEIESLRDR